MIFYAINVFLSLFIIDRRYSHFGIFILFNTLVWIVISEPYLDIQTYLRFFGAKYGFEAGYHNVTAMILQITGDRLTGLKFTQIFAFVFGLSLLFYFSNVKFKLREFMIVLALFSNSIFFKLGNFNVLRQYIGCVIAMGAIGTISTYRGVMYLYVASLFHKSVLILTLNFLVRYFRGSIAIIALIVLAVVSIASLKLIIGYTRYGFYLDIGQYDDRTNSVIRLIPVTLIFASTLYMRRAPTLDNDRLFSILFKLNITIFAFIFALSFEPIFNEIQSRVIYYYFFVALFLYCRAMCLSFNVLMFLWFIFFNAAYPSALIVSIGGV